MVDMSIRRIIKLHFVDIAGGCDDRCRLECPCVIPIEKQAGQLR